MENIMLKQHVVDTIENNSLIKSGEGVIVGVSGGYDSVCLLHVLHSISDKLNMRLYPVHINHMLRGAEADRDELFVKELCASMDLELTIKRVDIPKMALQEKISLEEAGRNARYQEFDRVAHLVGATKIAVAHNRNDQAETVLMRICRGTGLDGIKGMGYIRDNVIRPLLEVDRKDIEQYVKSNGLQGVTDSSNLHTDYFRNRVRLNVLPEINKAIGLDVTDNLIRLSKIVVTDDDYLRYNSEMHYADILIKKEDFYIELDIEKLKKLHQAMISRVLRMAIQEAADCLIGVEFIHIEKLIQLVKQGRTGARLDLPLKLKAVKSYNTLAISKQVQQEIEDFEQKLQVSGNNYISDINLNINTEIIKVEANKNALDYLYKNNYDNFFDFDKINDNIFIRNRRNGDLFKPLNSNGTKKLKEYFIDNKIPRQQRDKFPLIAMGKEILWIIGNKTSDKFKVTENTKTILKISQKRS